MTTNKLSPQRCKVLRIQKDLLQTQQEQIHQSVTKEDQIGHLHLKDTEKSELPQKVLIIVLPSQLLILYCICIEQPPQFLEWDLISPVNYSVPYIFLQWRHLSIFQLSNWYFLVNPSLSPPVPFREWTFSQYLSTEPHPVSRPMVGMSWLNFKQVPSSSSAERESDTCYIPPNKNWGSQQYRRSQDQEKFIQIGPKLPSKWMGKRGLCWYNGSSFS